MKTLLLSILSLFLSVVVMAQCDNLIISEYVEGWSNNKAIEIYNASPDPIDMGPYSVVRFRNQAQEPSNPVNLEGILMPYDTYVIVIDKRDSTGVDFEAPVWSELQMKADSFVNPVWNNGMETMYFNGNDALGLINEDATVIFDFFGKLADLANPDGWGPYTDSQGEAAFISQDHTLVRKPTVMQGVMQNPAVFDILAEWDSLPANTFDNLGFHLSNCDPSVGIEELRRDDFFRIFPNPVENGTFKVSAQEEMAQIEIYSISGAKVFEMYLDIPQVEIEISTAALQAGAYLVNLRSASNIVSTQRIIIK